MRAPHAWLVRTQDAHARASATALGISTLSDRTWSRASGTVAVRVHRPAHAVRLSDTRKLEQQPTRRRMPNFNLPDFHSRSHLLARAAGSRPAPAACNTRCWHTLRTALPVARGAHARSRRRARRASQLLAAPRCAARARRTRAEVCADRTHAIDEAPAHTVGLLRRRQGKCE